MERLSRERPEARAPAGGGEARPSAGRSLLLLALVLAAAFALHLPALRLPFFADDFLFLDQARHHSLLSTLAAPDPIGNFYRPVGRQLYFWFVSHAGAESPRAAHAVNLGLLLVAIVLLHDVARRLAGARAALVAAALVALHYAADVPVRWASGSQDLLAVTLGLASLSLHLAGRRWVAALALLLAALSKEVVLLTPLIAAIAGRRRGEPWRDSVRRAWPLAAAIVAWVLVVLLAARAGAARPGAAAPDGSAVLATFVHLAQVAVGVEWRTGGIARLEGAIPPLVPLLLVVAAIALLGPARLTRGRGARGGMRPGGAGVRAGVAWALAGAVPIVAVAPIWSAYYYLFAVCGAALALGAWLSDRPRGLVVALIVLIACGSARSASLEESAIARRPWTARSHINRFYIERATQKVEGYLRALRAARPALPPRSTLFFAGLSGGVGFQSGDGALLRHAYGDSSLRSYYLSAFDVEKARRGPLFFFLGVPEDSLREVPDTPDRYSRLGLAMILGDLPAPARALLESEGARSEPSEGIAYWLAWLHLALSDRPRGLEALARAGLPTTSGPSPEIAAARTALAAGDTLDAVRLATLGCQRYPLDPAAHGLLADLRLGAGETGSSAVIEAYAARVLAPDWPVAWRRWGMVQLQHQRYLEGLASFDRYFALAGEAGARDAEARRWVDLVRRVFPAAGNAPVAEEP